jgi:hypothetical protein
MKHYTKVHGLRKDQICFYFIDDTELNDADTPEKHDMKNGDVIYVKNIDTSVHASMSTRGNCYTDFYNTTKTVTTSSEVTTTHTRNIQKYTSDVQSLTSIATCANYENVYITVNGMYLNKDGVVGDTRRTAGTHHVLWLARSESYRAVIEAASGE